MIDRVQETPPAQSINKSFPPQVAPPPHRTHQRPPISDLTGASLCVIVVKGKVTFFCRLMGFFNNGEMWEQQKRPAFSFFNGAAPGRCQRPSKTWRSALFIIHIVRLQLPDKVTGLGGAVMADSRFSPVQIFEQCAR